MQNIVETVVVSAEQMQQIEEQVFQAGMPVAALMEKAARLCCDRLQALYPLTQISQVGILAGPGHNGADALVIARELHLAGYKVKVFRPFFKLKTLTTQHSNYAVNLGIPLEEEIQALNQCQLIVDGLFGFGLTRELPENIIEVVKLVNSWSKPVVSIDLPSGIHTDTGTVLGAAIKATHTFCLGLWKRAFFQDPALEYIGNSEQLDLGLRPHHICTVLPEPVPLRQMTSAIAMEYLPLPRPAITYKYRQGHLLLICGSRQYAGAAILTALGARASGAGMVSVAIPESLKTLIVSHLPEVLIVDCPENKEGAIASLPFSTISLSKFQAIACGPGLSMDAKSVVGKVLQAECPLLLDADGLNILAELGTEEILNQRDAPTVLTPHAGEFKRLFPEIALDDRLNAVSEAAQASQATVLLKGAKTLVSQPQGSTWSIADSTPALARGGSGDVLTGLVGGLLAQEPNLHADRAYHIVASGAWWHAQAGIAAANERSQLGVDATTLTQYLSLAIAKQAESKG